MGIGLFGLTGCGGIKYLDETRAVDATAAFQLMDRRQFEEFDLPMLIASAADAAQPNTQDCQDRVGRVRQGLSSSGAANGGTARNGDLESAFTCFREKTKGLLTKEQIIARNCIQERVLAASVQRCNAFESNLQRTFARNNFFSGLVSTATGTAGALVTGVEAARILSGISGVASGYRAEFNQDYMSNLAAYVIIDGIEKRRRDVYAQIQLRGQGKGLADYPLEAAVKDALLFHGQCSVIAGFQEASDSIKYMADPGLDTSIRVLSKIKLAAELSDNPAKSPAQTAIELEEINKKLAISPLNLAGSLLGDVKAWSMTGINDDAGASYLNILAAKEKFDQQVAAWQNELSIAPSSAFKINSYAEMIEVCKKARVKMEEVMTSMKEKGLQCDQNLLSEQCRNFDNLGELLGRVADGFINQIAGKRVALQKEFDAALNEKNDNEKSGSKAATKLDSFKKSLAEAMEISSNITAAMADMNVLLK
jgi:hypothetical protein